MEYTGDCRVKLEGVGQTARFGLLADWVESRARVETDINKDANGMVRYER